MATPERRVQGQGQLRKGGFTNIKVTKNIVETPFSCLAVFSILRPKVGSQTAYELEQLLMEKKGCRWVLEFSYNFWESHIFPE